ncbi:hypothetical protein EYR36_006902 [Pleurotus pulmonarius]|nr:hypothetical protein EYR36_006902 [Pleurotus pulmonarius]
MCLTPQSRVPAKGLTLRPSNVYTFFPTHASHVFLFLVPGDRKCPFYDYLHKLTVDSGREGRYVRHLTIDVMDPLPLLAKDYIRDIEALLRMLPGLQSFSIADPNMTNAYQRLLDPFFSPLPPRLRKLRVSLSTYDVQRLSAFLCMRGISIAHLEVHPSSQIRFLPLTGGALPALRILSARTVDSILHNLSEARSLTHIQLSPDGGVGLHTIYDFQAHAASLANVTTLSCSASALGIFHAAGMLPSLERLDAYVVGDIDDLWYEPLVIHTSPGHVGEFDAWTDGARMRGLKMLRLTSRGKTHSHAFVQWAFKRFPGLRSLELPYLSKEASSAVAASTSDGALASSFAEPGILFGAPPSPSAHLEISYKLEVRERELFYRFANAKDMPSLIRWKCRPGEEWFHDWTRDVEVVVKSVPSEEYSLAPASMTLLLNAMNF